MGLPRIGLCLACAAIGWAAGPEDRLKADVTFLAADELEGRGTPSRGLDLAALYLESQLRAAGIEPFRQTYTVGTYAPKDAAVRVTIDGKPVAPSDFVFINFGRDPARGPLELACIDAGTGVVAEEKGQDELSALDVRGKAVVVRKGAPWPLEAAAVFGPDRAMGKLMAATVRGAQMLVYLSDELDTGNEAEAGFFQNMKNADVAFIRQPPLTRVSALNPILILKSSATGAKPQRVRIEIEAPVREGKASNILGKIAGTDAALRDEWVVLSAHYDHVGAHQVPPGQDGIWNGADDNASGTAAVLELARELAARPGKRSVLVFFTSGEDRGIFGSAVYGDEPVVPMKQVAVQLNLDMIGRSDGSVQAIAPIAPQLFDEAVSVGRRHGVRAVPDQQPAWRVLYLTDNYHFARMGVPGIFFFTGVHADYHQPTDTADKINYEGMTRIVRLAAEMARGYADGRKRPAFVRPKWFLTPDQVR